MEKRVEVRIFSTVLRATASINVATEVMLKNATLFGLVHYEEVSSMSELRELVANPMYQKFAFNYVCHNENGACRFTHLFSDALNCLA